MAPRLLLVILFACLVWPLDARAQLDDLLAPLTPPETREPARKKPKPAKPAPRKKSARERAEGLNSSKDPESARGRSSAAPAAGRGRLQVAPSPADRPARLLVDGEDVGEIPSAPFELPSGRHTVEVRRPGFADFKATVEIAPGQLRTLEAELTPVSAVVEVLSNVDEAEVWMEGRRLGTTPLRQLMIPTGSYAMQVRKPGYAEERSQLSVKAGREYTVQATLKPLVVESDKPLATALLTPSDELESDRPLVGTTQRQALQPPIYKRWYFWTAAAAVVVAAGVTTYVLSQDNGPTDPCSRAFGGGECAVVQLP